MKSADLNKIMIHGVALWIDDKYWEPAQWIDQANGERIQVTPEHWHVVIRVLGASVGAYSGPYWAELPESASLDEIVEDLRRQFSSTVCWTVIDEEVEADES